MSVHNPKTKIERWTFARKTDGKLMVLKMEKGEFWHPDISKEKHGDEPIIAALAKRQPVG